MLVSTGTAPARGLPLKKPVVVDDQLWATIGPLLSYQKPRRQRYPGRKPLDNRKILAGVLFVLKTGTPWERLPQEVGCGSGMTCWRRLRDWQHAGVWPQIQRILLDRLPEADQLDWSRAIVETSLVRARRREPSVLGSMNQDRPEGSRPLESVILGTTP